MTSRVTASFILHLRFNGPQSDRSIGHVGVASQIAGGRDTGKRKPRTYLDSTWQIRRSDSVRIADPVAFLVELRDEPLKPWIGTQITKRRFHTDIEEAGIALLVCCCQPTQCLVSIVILHTQNRDPGR